jgi:glucose-6-phosphate isomerase
MASLSSRLSFRSVVFLKTSLASPRCMSAQTNWEHFKSLYFDFPSIGLAVDLSKMDFPVGFFETMEPRMQQAFAEMRELEKGAIANADEKRMVGHYWLRRPDLAPNAQMRQEIADTQQAIKKFAADVHQGTIAGQGGSFKNVLLIGIGGSALGPQFVTQALGDPKRDKLQAFFFDNTDPDGMDRVLAELDGQLNRTLCIVISKSGGTKETRNGMLIAQAAFKKAGLDFGQHAVAITQIGSELSKVADREKWIAQFPMWDWVGGRTSETSAVGLLPAALQGFPIDDVLNGAAACDLVTRHFTVRSNPAALLALAWCASGNGKGVKDMVILPYKDRLELFSRYLQQLVMESLGKELDRNGARVNQGIAVYGNKGSTDQHAYVQQLREGVNNFFVTFIDVLKDGGAPLFVEPNVTAGDYLTGFYLGTRTALRENGRESISLTIQNVNAVTVGMLIALFERTVGLYASLVNINAYHQPGVEAGKKAATAVIGLQLRIIKDISGEPMTVASLAAKIGTDDLETVFKVCEHLAANGRLKKVKGATPFDAKYSAL